MAYDRILLANVRSQKIPLTNVQAQFDATIDENQSNEFLGLGKKEQMRKTAKKTAKTDIKQAKADRIRDKGRAALIAAEKGTVKPTVLESITGAISGILGGGSGNVPQMEQTPTETPQTQYVESAGTVAGSSNEQKSPKGKNNTLVYVGIVAAAMVVIYLIVKKK